VETDYNYKKVLIIQLQPIGDVVRATPVVAKLQERYPQSRIDFLIYDRYAELLEGNPRVNEIITLNGRFRQENININQILEELKELADRLQEKRFDLVVNLHDTTLSGILAYLTKAKEIKGVVLNEFGHFTIPPGWIINPHESGLNLVEAYLRNVGLDTEGANLEVYLEEEDLAFRDEFLRKEGIGEKELLIGLNPGAAVYSKRWPKEGFAQVGDQLSREYRAKLILFGGPQDKGLADEMVRVMESTPINLVGRTTLKGLAALLERCNLFITNDSGPMHIAAAVNTPMVAIFGSSSLKANSPYGGRYVTLQADLPCVPCGRSYCEELNCLKSITVEEVLASCRKILKEDT